MTAVRRRWLVAAAAALLLATASACGADGNADTSATTTSSRSDTTGEPSTTTTGGDGDITEDQLTAALLTVDDLPTGFAASKDEDDDDSDDETDDLNTDDPACQAAIDALDAATNDEGDEVSALAGFERDDVEEVEHALKAVPDAAQRLDRVRSTLEDDCGNRVEFSTDDAGSGVLEVVDGAEHGEGTFYARMTLAATAEGTELEVTAILVYAANADVGSTITLVAADIPSMDVDTDEPTMEDAERLAATAEERYEDVFG